MISNKKTSLPERAETLIKNKPVLVIDNEFFREGFFTVVEADPYEIHTI
jgi:hypothetical protein